MSASPVGYPAPAYRITSSIIRHLPEVLKAFRARGIHDYCNALPQGHRSVQTQVFVLEDGQVVPSDSRTVSEIARELGQRRAA